MYVQPHHPAQCFVLVSLLCCLLPSLASGHLDGQLLLPHGFLSRAAFAGNLLSFLSLVRAQLSHRPLSIVGFCLPAQRRRQQAAKTPMP